MYIKAMNVTDKVMIANNNINAKTVDSYKNWIKLINEPKADSIFPEPNATSVRLCMFPVTLFRSYVRLVRLLFIGCSGFLIISLSFLLSVTT